MLAEDCGVKVPDDSADAVASDADDDDLLHAHHYRVFYFAAGPGFTTNTLQSDFTGAGAVSDFLYYDAGF